MNDLSNPHQDEAPLVAILQLDIHSMTPDELRAHTESIRALRAVPATRKAAKNKSSTAIKQAKGGVDLNALFGPKK